MRIGAGLHRVGDGVNFHAIQNRAELRSVGGTEGDGGSITFKSYVDGIVTVQMRGACSGCPSSTLTLKAGIEGLLKRMIPDVTEVVSEAM